MTTPTNSHKAWTDKGGHVNGFEVLNIRRLVAHTHSHDHLMVAVDGQLAVVALQVRPA